MITAILIAVFITGALSLLSYAHCLQDIWGGRPHIISLRQITGIMDRHRLSALFGAPQPGFYYAFSRPQVLALLYGRLGFMLREVGADMLCIAGVWWYMTGHGAASAKLWFALLAGLYQAASLAQSFWLMSKWQDQIREEI